jgi:hypothetical protein
MRLYVLLDVGAIECNGAGVQAMNLRSRATVAGAVSLITMAICFFGVRAELNSVHRSGNLRAGNQRISNQRAPQVDQLDRGEADRYCARHIADGC